MGKQSIKINNSKEKMRLLIILFFIYCGGDAPSGSKKTNEPVASADRIDTTYYSDSTIHTTTGYSNGVKHGCYKEYNTRGILIVTICYHKGGYGVNCGCL